MNKKILVIGAGAAGMMAAVTAAKQGAQVIVAERNARPGRKLMITGKGRCNVTNACEPREFFTHMTSEPRFMFSSLAAFDAQDTCRFFEQAGVPLKVERGQRVFPTSDRASDIVDALVREMKKTGVRLENDRILSLKTENGKVTGAEGEKKHYTFDSCIIATGGLSYPLTGSTGDGYDFARSAGHTVITPRASLVPMEAEGSFCRDCMGVSLRNVELALFRGEKEIFSDFGEMLFTHFGLSGPIVLSASAHMGKSGDYRVIINLKPALSPEKLNERILREISENPRRSYGNLLHALLPGKMAEPFCRLSEIPGGLKSAEITRAQREKLITLLQALPIRITGLRPVEEAIVTAGGVDIREIDPKTMASRKIKGLFFAGEVMDVSAETGGFNLQIAFSTGRAAGIAASE